MSSDSHRDVRFVCISDTHNASPKSEAFKLPQGDVLIHAGDMTKQGTPSELRKTLKWISSANFEVKIVIAGNHDISLDRNYYTKNELEYHRSDQANIETCIKMFKDANIDYLNHETREITLKSGSRGPKTIFKVFGSPYSPMRGAWAFGYQPQSEGAQELWGKIPSDTDIIVTHTPARNHCDKAGVHAHAGCEVLAQTLGRVKPRLFVCGHTHEGRGAERVIWKPESSDSFQGEELMIGQWRDTTAGTKKQSRVVLEKKPPQILQRETFVDEAWTWLCHGSNETFTMKDRSLSPNEGQPFQSKSSQNLSAAAGGPAAQSSVLDLESHKSEFKETVIINAAIMASSWPYKGNGHRKYNKPIVVDISLPIQEARGGDE